MSILKSKIPNNADTRKLYKVKLWGAFLDVFHQFKAAAESYQHPALPINAYSLTHFLETLELADKWVKEAKEEYTPSPFRDEFGGGGFVFPEFSICSALRHTSQYKELSKCVKEQEDLRKEVDDAFYGFLGHVNPEKWEKDPSKWKYCGTILSALKVAYIDSLLLIEEGAAGRSIERFQERVQEIKVDHIAPFEHKCQDLGKAFSAA